MRTSFVCFLTVGTALCAAGQFYPEANACWHGWDDDGGPPGYAVQYQMGASPDTLINGIGYKKVDEYRDYVFARTYLVRSDPNGRGYAYLPDSAAEFLTGDLTAQVGDTIHDVLWSNTTSSPNVDYFMVDMVVSSVVTLTNAGVTVIRHYVGPDLSSGNNYFWQRGMGLRSGPMLELTGGFSDCSVSDTVMFGGINGLPGPIGVQVCPPVNGNGIDERTQFVELQARPNPSTGLFHFTGTTLTEIHILDTQGRTLFTTNKPEVDLSAYPVGCYRAVVVSESGKSSLPLVVVR
jgi:hypothetical protein